MRLKIFTLGNSGFVRPEVAALVKRPEQSDFHARQQSVYVPATSRTAAARVAGQCGIQISASDKELRIASGDDLDALTSAGVFQAGHVYVLGQNSHFGPVAELAPGQPPKVIGHIGAGEDGPRKKFTAIQVEP
jgi:hypothetical protein